MNRISASRATFAGLLLTFTLYASALPAQEAHDGTDTHSSEHSYHANTIGMFVGFATEDEGVRENGFALGLEYEYRINQRFGIGGVIERTGGDIDTWVYAIPFAYHNGSWKLYVAPGIEDGEHGSEDLIRFGVEYGFHFDKWEISPQLDLDIVDRDTEVWVLGVVFARGFEFK